jgi:deoxyribose-phosphate aldolase
MSADVARRALACLDLTDLTDDCRPSAIDALIKRAVTPFGPVAALCIWPQFVEFARPRLAAPIRVATVINFPAGGENPDRAASDAREALQDGADEIDCVLPYRALMRGDETTVRDVIDSVAQEIGDRTLKVILETGALASPALIARAGEIAIECGAHFIKTSTGKIAVSATPQAATTMLETIRASGRPVGFKAAGGIRTVADAQTYLDLADRIMGPGWAAPATFRFGASGLLDALLAELQGREAKGADGY